MNRVEVKIDELYKTYGVKEPQNDNEQWGFYLEKVTEKVCSNHKPLP